MSRDRSAELPECHLSTTGIAGGKSAFTLVELLVVIGIIALLISILLPALNKARESGNLVKCQANLRQIGQALMMYTNNHKGMLPIGFVYKGEATPSGSITVYNGETVDWTTLLIGTLKSRKDLASSGWDSQGVVNSDTAGLRKMFICPSNAIVPQISSYQLNYTAHPRLLPDLGTNDYHMSSSAGLQTRRIGSVKRSAEIATIFDGVIENTSSGNGSWNATLCAYGLDYGNIYSKPYLTDDYTIKPAYNGGQPVDMNPHVGSVPKKYNADDDKNVGNIRFRHNKDTAANALMLDGHVQTFHFDLKKCQANNGQNSTDLLRSNINVNP